MPQYAHESGRGPLLRAVLVPLLVMLASTGLTTLWLWSKRAELRDTVAVHWGPKGQPDGWASLSSALTSNAVIAVVMVVLLVALAAVVRERVLLPAVASGLAVFISGSMSALIAKQTRDAAAPDLGFELALGLLAGAVVGAAVGFGLSALRRREPQPIAPAGSLPADAPVLDIPPSTPVTWVGETRNGAALWVLPFVGVIPVAGFLVYAAANQLWGIVAFLVPLLVLLSALFLMVKCHVTVDERGLRATAGRITWMRIPLEQIVSAEVDHVEPLGDFGGWGIRFGFRGLGLVTSRGPAVWIDRAQNTRACVTVTDPEGCVAAINTLVSRRT